MEYNCFNRLYDSFKKEFDNEEKCLMIVLGYLLIFSLINLVLSIIIYIIFLELQIILSGSLVWLLVSAAITVAFIISFLMVASKIDKKKDDFQKKRCDFVRDYCIKEKLYCKVSLEYLEEKCNKKIVGIDNADNFFTSVLIPISVPVAVLVLEQVFGKNNETVSSYGLFWLILMVTLILVMLFIRTFKIFHKNYFDQEAQAYRMLADILLFLKAKQASASCDKNVLNTQSLAPFEDNSMN